MNRYEWLDKRIPKVTVPEGKSGDWEVRRHETADSPITAFRERHFCPGVYTQLRRKGALWMSDTPAERMDHLDFIRAAKGHVLISGLGIGVCIGPVLAKPEVESITVLEIAPEVIELIAGHYADPRLTVVETDALTWKPPKGIRYGAVWHDIWRDICADNLPEMHTLNRRYARKADWKSCWSQDLIRRYERRYA
jgi:hypothetical protein